MRSALAERILAEVMGWSAEDVARERPDLQALAAYKYDEYQQFSPGMRFVESLAIWLNQFRTIPERRIAYEFVRTKLIFCSVAEMNHLVNIAYHDHIRPQLLRRAAHDLGIGEHLVSKIADEPAFKVRQRQCLFLGLSDGARIDVFRRSNSSDLTHEQILQTYEVSDARIDELLRKLSASLSNLMYETPLDKPRFRTVILLDDFSGSGLSYLRRDVDGSLKGKIGEFHRSITATEGAARRLVDLDALEVIVVLYMATDQARDHLEGISKEVWSPLGVSSSIIVVHQLNSSICLARDDTSPIGTLAENYYDSAVEDEHTKIGGDNVKYGFAKCGLPLVLSHNTPNNSLSLLWSETNRMRALFPRVSRHKRQS